MKGCFFFLAQPSAPRAAGGCGRGVLGAGGACCLLVRAWVWLARGSLPCPALLSLLAVCALAWLLRCLALAWLLRCLPVLLGLFACLSLLSPSAGARRVWAPACRLSRAAFLFCPLLPAASPAACCSFGVLPSSPGFLLACLSWRLWPRALAPRCWALAAGRFLPPSCAFRPVRRSLLPSSPARCPFASCSSLWACCSCPASAFLARCGALLGCPPPGADSSVSRSKKNEAEGKWSQTYYFNTVLYQANDKRKTWRTPAGMGQSFRRLRCSRRRQGHARL